jgi:hypothetical protein
MTTPLFSLLHATRRPEKAVAAMHLWLSRAGISSGIEYIFAADKAAGGIGPIIKAIGAQPGLPISFVECETEESVAAWNAAYARSTGMVLVQVSDDFEPPENWANLLAREIADNVMAWRVPTVIAVSDGFRKDRLLTMAICTRAYCELAGGFLPAEYASVFSDGEFTLRAYQRQKIGVAKVIEARHLMFRHRHHWADASVPWDKVYEQQNSAQRYHDGAEMFRSRNPTWWSDTMPDGSKICDWI